jgi:ABC-type uncharacterized transport system substrate-binding protein
MKRAVVPSVLIVVVMLAVAVIAEAQQAEKVFRIGYLGTSGSGPPRAFRQGLRDFGYVEGRNVVIEFRTRRGKSGWSELADELVGLKVDVIVASGAGAVTAAKNASATTPIVMEQVNDPIALGLVASLAHPGGNITGISNLSPELSGKRLELLKEVIPKVYRVAALTSRRGAAMQTSIKETEAAAQSLRLQLQLLEVKEADEIESAFDAAKKQRADALVQIQASFFEPHQQRIIDLAAKYRLPAMYNNRDDVEIGGLMSYGPDREEMNRRVAAIVDKILKGRKPADLPVEQPTKFEFVINLKTAKQIGVTIPPNVLARADKVVK